MSTSPETVAHILDQCSAAGDVSARKMFGEYALYLDGRVVALICDDTLYLKPLPGAHALLPDATEGFPYPGAKAHLVGDMILDDPDLAARVLRAIAAEVPPPRPNIPKG